MSAGVARSAFGVSVAISVIILGALASAGLMYVAALMLLAPASLMGALAGVAGLLIAKLILLRTVSRARQLYRNGVPRLGAMVSAFEQSVAGQRPLTR